MRVPHVISKNILELYKSSKATLQLGCEVHRKIIPEDLTWDNDLCPSLVTLCVQAIAKNFQNKQIFHELPCAERDHLLEILPTDLPLEIVVPLIEAEFYWERRYVDGYGKTARGKPVDRTWKSAYLERHIQEVLEQAQPQYSDEEQLDDIIKLCNPYVRRITVTQLQSWKPPLTADEDDIPEVWPVDHINFEPILKKFDNIKEVDVVYAMREVGTEFAWRMFELSIGDLKHLGKALQYQKNLLIFRMHRTAIDDERARVLMQSIVNLNSIVELDLSHCLIEDQGALCVAKVLLTRPTLQKLVLANNRIEETGATGLGFALLQPQCCPLTHLDLRLNPLSHDGTMAILRSLVRTDKPKELSLAGCMIAGETSFRVAQMVRLNASLTSLDLSGNYFDVTASLELLDAMRTNRTMRSIDLRDTDVPHETIQAIEEALRRNRLRWEESLTIGEQFSVDEEKEVAVAIPLL